MEETKRQERKIAIRSVGSKVGAVFGILFSGLLMLISVLIATPFFILSVLINWIKMSIGLAIFWVLASAVYQVVILNSGAYTNPFESGWTVLILLVIALIGAIMATISEIKE